MSRIPYALLAVMAWIRGVILSATIGGRYRFWPWTICPLGNRQRYTSCHSGFTSDEARHMYYRHGWIPLVFRTINGLTEREFLIEQTDEEIELGNAMCAAYVEYANMVSQEMAGARSGGDPA